MSASNPSRLEIPGWAWAAAAAGLILILGGLLWSGPSSAPGRIGTDAARAKSVDPLRVAAEQPSAAVPILANSPRSVARPGIAVKINPSPRAKTGCVVKKPAARPVTPRDMFPMGSITRGIPYELHPYRQASEGFPSFGYGERIWNFTGRFAKGGQVDLAPTGFYLTGRKVLAIANTAGPGRVLFVQSFKDPGRFAIYRSLRAQMLR